MPNFTFCEGRKQAMTKFILFMNLDMVDRNSAPEEFPCIWQSKRVGSDGDFKSKWQFPDCVHFFGAWARQAVIETIPVMYKHTKRTHWVVFAYWAQYTKHLLFPFRSRHPLEFWKWSGESRHPGAPLPVLKNSRPAFSPDTTDCPWVSEDVWVILLFSVNI